MFVVVFVVDDDAGAVDIAAVAIAVAVAVVVGAAVAVAETMAINAKLCSA